VEQVYQAGQVPENNLSGLRHYTKYKGGAHGLPVQRNWG